MQPLVGSVDLIDFECLVALIVAPVASQGGLTKLDELDIRASYGTSRLGEADYEFSAQSVLPECVVLIRVRSRSPDVRHFPAISGNGGLRQCDEQGNG